MGLGGVASKKLFPETIIHKIFVTNSSFYVKYVDYGKSSISVFQEIFTSTNKIFILQERWNTRQYFYKVFLILEIFLIFPNFARSFGNP